MKTRLLSFAKIRLIAASLLCFNSSKLVASDAPQTRETPLTLDFEKDGIAIIVPDEPLKALNNRGEPQDTQADAAGRLQMLIEKATGHCVPIVKAGEMPGSGVRIFVGYGPHLKGRITPPAAPEGIAISRQGDDLFIVGEISPKGTNNWPDAVDRGLPPAVEIFAERVLDFRFFFSSLRDPALFEIGTVIPQIKTLTIGSGLPIEEAPAFQHRMSHGRNLDYIGLQTGSSLNFECNHTHDVAAWKTLYGKEHPELFVQRPDGSRNWKHLDYAEPLVLQKELEHLDAFFKTGKNTGFARTPTAKYITATPTDDYAWPGSASAAARKLVKPCSKNTRKDMVNAECDCQSNLVFEYVRKLALETKNRWPDMRVSTLAYQWNTQPPDFDLPDNVDVMLCLMRSSLQSKQPENFEYNLKLVREWSRKLGNSRERLLLWEYLCWPGLHVTPPTITPHTMQTWLKAARPYVSGVFINSFYRDVSPFEFVMYRVWMRLLWNPDLDVDAEIADICRRFFGPAGDTMLEFHEKLIARCEKPWDNPELVENQFYATPDLYYGQSFPPDQIRELAALLEKARKEAGLPADLTSAVKNGTAIHLFNAEAVAVPVGITLTALPGKEILNPVVIWDEGRVTYQGRILPGEHLVVSGAGEARLVNTKTKVSRDVPVVLGGKPPMLAPGADQVFSFLQSNAGDPFQVKLTYANPASPAASPGGGIHATRLDWFRRPYQIFHPSFTYGMAGQAFTGFFAEAHVAHQHLGKVPSYRAKAVATLPLTAEDPVWKTTQEINLVRGRETPKDQICRWDYLSQNNVLPFNNFGFPAARPTTARCVHSPDGLAVLVDAVGSPVAGENISLHVNGKTFEFPIQNAQNKPPFVRQLQLNDHGWSAVVVLDWEQIGAKPAPEEVVPFQIQRNHGSDSAIWSPPLGSIWGHRQQGAGNLVLAPDR